MLDIYELHNALELYIEIHPFRVRGVLICSVLLFFALTVIISNIVGEIKGMIDDKKED